MNAVANGYYLYTFLLIFSISHGLFTIYYMNTTPTTLYRHFDSNDNLLYVGISVCAFKRLKEHKKYSKWSNKAVKMLHETFNTREEALIAERNAIKKERPLYNIIHNDGIIISKEEIDDLSYTVINAKNKIEDAFYELTGVGHLNSMPAEVYEALRNAMEWAERASELLYDNRTNGK